MNQTEDHPFIKDIIYVAPQANWSFPLHIHENSAELSLLINGCGTFYAGSMERVIRKGVLVAKNGGLQHAEKSDPHDPLEQICIEIGGIHRNGLTENNILPDYMEPVIDCGEAYDLMEAAFRYMMLHYNESDQGDICSALLEMTLNIIRNRVKAYVPRPEHRPRGKKELISETINYLDAHYRERLKIRNLAELFYTSEGNLSRQFKAVTGYTINEYIISKRMGEAERLLIYEDDEIKDVAAQCGYDDLQYFYRIFKRYANCTPAEFRSRYRNG
ncbi:MAG: helix-turn-helix transcriptional regulator [Eubacterium sp.]|nr:helix-turn-helix transcriptional regulator [Eubacterium sp.]